MKPIQTERVSLLQPAERPRIVAPPCFHFAVERPPHPSGSAAQAPLLPPQQQQTAALRPPSAFRALQAGYGEQLSRFAGLLARQLHLDSVQVEGLPALRGQAALCRTGSAMVWAATHTDLTTDPMLFAGLARHLRQFLRAQGVAQPPLVHALTRQPTDALQWMALSMLMRPFTHQVVLPKDGAPTDPMRRPKNQEVLHRLRADVLSKGEHVILFPQGTTRGTGDLSIPSTGGLRKLSQNGEGMPVPVVPLGVTYEFFGSAKPRVILTVGETSFIETPEQEGQVAVQMREALLRLNAVTLSGIVGALVLERQQGGRTCRITRKTLAWLVDQVVGLVSQQTSLAIDQALLDPRREKTLDRAYAGLVALNYLTPDGYTTGHIDCFKEQHAKQAHREDPLGFSGLRLQAQAKLDGTLAAILTDAFARYGNGAAPVADQAPATENLHPDSISVSSCHIM